MNKNGYGRLVEWLCITGKMLYLLLSWPVYILLYEIKLRAKIREDLRNGKEDSLKKESIRTEILEVEE